MEVDTTIHHLWGTDNSPLGMLQMGIRALITFVVAIILVRIAGRRSFGMKSPFDNTFVILLGSILAQGVIGRVSFGSGVAACTVLAVAHRVFAYFGLKWKKFGGWIKGDKILIYEDGILHEKNMTRSLISESDLLERVRMQGCESLDDIKVAYMERNGEISVIKK